MGYSGPNLSNLSNIEPYTYVVYKSGSTYYAFESASGSVKYTNASFTSLMNTIAAAISSPGSIFIKNPGTTISVGATMTFQNKSVHIYGDNTSIDYSGYDANIFVFEDTSTRGVYNCGVHDFQVKGLYTHTSEVFVKFSNVTGVVEHIFTNDTDKAYRLVWTYEECQGTRIFNNKGRFYCPIKLEGTASYDSRGASIVNNWFDSQYDGSNLNYCIDIDYGLGIRIIGNLLENTCYCINGYGTNQLIIGDNYITAGVEGININGSHHQISNNHIFGRFLNNKGVIITNTYGGCITGNTFYSYQNNNCRFIELQSVAHVTIVGNIFQNEMTPTGCIGIYSTSTETDITIVGNVFSNIASITGTAISISTLNNSVIAYNSIVNWTTGITIGSKTATLVYDNIGYITKNQGATSVADGGTISHGLVGTPTGVICTPITSGEMVSVTAKAASTFTVAIKTHAGGAGTTAVVHWYAWID